MVFSRKRKDNRSPSFILDDSPKRTKVQAQRKFAQGSNVNSPVLTPVKEIEQEKIIPEPIDLLPMKRPNTEDFLTFLCFRGTPVLPPSLNFFNSAAMIDNRLQTNDSPGTSSKNGVILPSTIIKSQGERPFIAFGVRKRADPIVVSRHMDKKRRHALALQALRRKYQEQKMAKIRAITISKLSEKVQTNKTVVRTTRSITKTGPGTKKNITQKTKITVVATKRVKVTTRRTSTLTAPIRSNIKQKMCLRSYRGRFVQRELLNKPVKKRPINKKMKNVKEANIPEEVEEEEEGDEEEEYSSEDEPLLKKLEAREAAKKVINIKKVVPKKSTDVSIRLTRSNVLINKIGTKRQKKLLVRTQTKLKSPPSTPRLRSRLPRKIAVLNMKNDVKIPHKKRNIINRTIEIRKKTLAVSEKSKEVGKKAINTKIEVKKPTLVKYENEILDSETKSRKELFIPKTEQKSKAKIEENVDIKVKVDVKAKKIENEIVKTNKNEQVVMKHKKSEPGNSKTEQIGEKNEKAINTVSVSNIKISKIDPPKSGKTLRSDSSTKQSSKMLKGNVKSKKDDNGTKENTKVSKSDGRNKKEETDKCDKSIKRVDNQSIARNTRETVKKQNEISLEKKSQKKLNKNNILVQTKVDLKRNKKGEHTKIPEPEEKKVTRSSIVENEKTTIKVLPTKVLPQKKPTKKTIVEKIDVKKTPQEIITSDVKDLSKTILKEPEKKVSIIVMEQKTSVKVDDKTIPVVQKNTDINLLNIENDKDILISDSDNVCSNKTSSGDMQIKNVVSNIVDTIHEPTAKTGLEDEITKIENSSSKTLNTKYNDQIENVETSTFDAREEKSALIATDTLKEKGIVVQTDNSIPVTTNEDTSVISIDIIKNKTLEKSPIHQADKRKTPDITESNEIITYSPVHPIDLKTLIPHVKDDNAAFKRKTVKSSPLHQIDNEKLLIPDIKENNHAFTIDALKSSHVHQIDLETKVVISIPDVKEENDYLTNNVMKNSPVIQLDINKTSFSDVEDDDDDDDEDDDKLVIVIDPIKTKMDNISSLQQKENNKTTVPEIMVESTFPSKKQTSSVQQPDNYKSLICTDTLNRIYLKNSPVQLISTLDIDENKLVMDKGVSEEVVEPIKNIQNSQIDIVLKDFPNKCVELKALTRPSRKTKEAATIYMEILGHKLGNEGVDDDVSIDSFPELPNVRKTEQRENELKAKAKITITTEDNKKTSDNLEIEDVTKKRKSLQKHNSSDSDFSTKQEAKIVKRIVENRKLLDKSSKKREKSSDSDISFSVASRIIEAKKTATPEKRNQKSNIKRDKSSGSDISFTVDIKTRMCDNKKSVPPEKRNQKYNTKRDKSSDSDISFSVDIKTPPEKLCRPTRNNSPKLYKSFSDTDSEEEDMVFVKKASIKRKSESEKSSKLVKKPKKIIDDDFGESDEEPLVKLTLLKKPKVEEKCVVGKQKRECTKRPQNYLPLFSSSDEDEKYFHGFVKCESPPKAKIIKTEPTIDLLFPKDVGRRYGKERVNMSNEQIEKWLNDSAMAGMSVIKKENDEMLKFGEKIPTETSLDRNMGIDTDVLKTSLLLKPIECTEEAKTVSLNSTPEKSISPIKPLSNERKMIFRKQKKEPFKNVNAFSVANESSVYAFEADTEDSVNTPFRRPSRRPSSTATSLTEDDSAKFDDKSGKFRHPVMKCDPHFKPITKQEASVTLSTDESNNSGTLAIQMNLDTTEGDVNTALVETKHMFYIPQKPTQRHSQTNKLCSEKVGMCAPLVRPLASSSPMCPPANMVQKNKSDLKKSFDRLSETSEDFKYKIPSSPSASSSSSAKLYKRTNKLKGKSTETYMPVNSTEFPTLLGPAQVVEAPVFHPTDKEFVDPLEYIEKIRGKAEKFGICRIVPPANFKPECKVLDEMRFTAYNQYVHKMMDRWGPNFRELVAIRKYLATQSITLKHPPWIGGMEIDLPRLYQTVQLLGGLKEVIEKKKWPRVSELMKIPKSAQDRVTKLDDIYCKYLLPYDTLSPAERDKLFDSVEKDWAKRDAKTLLKAQNGTEENDCDEDTESDEEDETDIECIVKGRSMALSAFYRIARNTMAMWFKNNEPLAQEVEEEFWKHVTTKQYHICVHSGSIDSGNWGYGFAVSKNSPFARHAWNLKVLTNNSGSILRSMGPVMGLTVPTLHVGMVFSGCCWYRDPHSLPWIEYLHTGANKIWYGIPDTMSDKFHTTLSKLVPNYCLNKSLWLPSDTAMLPPKILVDNGVSLTRTVQEPGQFVVIFPKAFTSNICTGYVVSESVFFAPPDWLHSAENVFKELRDSCEPSMFSYERLLLNIATDPRSDIAVLNQIIPAVQKLCDREKLQRAKLHSIGVINQEKLRFPDNKKKKKMHETETEYICEDCRWNLYSSMVMEIQDNAVYCLEHATEHIQAKQLEADKCKIFYTYDLTELEQMPSKVKALIEAKIQKKSGQKFTGMATLLNR